MRTLDRDVTCLRVHPIVVGGFRTHFGGGGNFSLDKTDERHYFYFGILRKYPNQIVIKISISIK